MKKYDPKKIEKKWRAYWQEQGIFKTSAATDRPKHYILDMFPYPSGAGLHVGHPKGYIATDVMARQKMMQGYSVLHPMGWDAFGLPAENYAIKNKVHPAAAVEKNIATFKAQLDLLGFTYDWDREISTTDPAYYRWTQWAFLAMFKRGLAYESNEPINWCPSCQTGLANEDLDSGRCERCGSVVEKKPLRQWVLKITNYADRLLQDLDQLPEWPNSIKLMQKEWIGRSEGLIFTAPVKDSHLHIQTFSAHFEAFAADTFVVIAPDHPLLPDLVKDTPAEKEVLQYAKQLVLKRMEAGHEEQIEGMFTGRYVIDPVGNGELPIWIASYALAEYGTGIVKCSAHDERDFAFAKKYGIRLKTVLVPSDPELRKKVAAQEVCFSDMKNGVLGEPTAFAGRIAGEARQDIMRYCEEQGYAKPTVKYKLRDWVFSRQRYWGEPIPLVYCEHCKDRVMTDAGYSDGEKLNPGWVAIPEAQLPLELPQVKSYEPTGTGESPLANIAEWVNTACPRCGGPARRETNTMPQWAGSCWYYLRYIDPDNNEVLVDKTKEQYWSPVDVYVGGAEHATRHLIYARFWHKFLYDIGVVNYPEPFTRLQNVGLILAEDGRKMSKRWNNVINPDDIIDQYGADAMRLYEMFMGPFDQAVAWSTQGLIGARRFLDRVWNLQARVATDDTGNTEKNQLTTAVHQTIKKVTEDIDAMRFNTAVSALMQLVNEAQKHESIPAPVFGILIKLLYPFAPHIAEELWSTLGNTSSLAHEEWPRYDADLARAEEFDLVVQVNGKVRDTFAVPSGIDEAEAKQLALGSVKIQTWLAGKEPKKVIYVKGKLVSVVV